MKRVIMNTTGQRWADPEEDIHSIFKDTMVPEDLYATTSLAGERSISTQPDERELYAAFEEAISDRVLAVSSQLKRLNTTKVNVRFLRSRRTALVKQGLIPFGNIWHRVLLLACIVCMLITTSFDLTCLILFHLH
jgi:hypothetical protein